MTDDINDKYLDMSDTDIDNLLFGIEINKVEKNDTICLGCNSDKLVFRLRLNNIIYDTDNNMNYTM